MPYCPFRHFPHPVTQMGFIRLACLIHAANVRSEPGSNPSKWLCLEESEPLPFRPFPPDARPVGMGEKTLPKSLNLFRLIGPTQRTRNDDPKAAVGKECVGRFKAPAPSHWLGAR
jgi:hypothetical protein